MLSWLCRRFHSGLTVITAKGKTRIKGMTTFTAAGQEIPGELDLTIESDTEMQPAAK